LKLVGFEIHFALAILAWVQDADTALAWANLRQPPGDLSIFFAWHREPGVRPYVLLDDGLPVAYGETWDDPAAGEIELARIRVAPARRNQGVGRIMVDRLLAKTSGSTPTAVFVRVRPGNAAALACYRRAGFAQVSPADAEVYNAGQPVEYVWLVRRPPTA
jgi:ribosomal protein S18 acetylase RimI-like enzyme